MKVLLTLLRALAIVAVIYIAINVALGYLSTVLERRLRTRRGGRVVHIDPGAQTDLLAALQEIEVVNAPGVDEVAVPTGDDPAGRA